MVATKRRNGKGISEAFFLGDMHRVWNMRNERPNVGGVPTRSRNGAPPLKQCVVNDQMIKASNN